MNSSGPLAYWVSNSAQFQDKGCVQPKFSTGIVSDQHESRKGLLQAYKAQSPFVHMTPIRISSIPSLPSYQHHLADVVILFSLPLLPATLFIMKYHSQKEKEKKEEMFGN